MAGQIQLKFVIGGPYPEGVFTAKLGNFCLGTIELQVSEKSIFLVSVNTHLFAAYLH